MEIAGNGLVTSDGDIEKRLIEWGILRSGTGLDIVSNVDILNDMSKYYNRNLPLKLTTGNIELIFYLILFTRRKFSISAN